MAKPQGIELLLPVVPGTELLCWENNTISTFLFTSITKPAKLTPLIYCGDSLVSFTHHYKSTSYWIHRQFNLSVMNLSGGKSRHFDFATARRQWDQMFYIQAISDSCLLRNFLYFCSPIFNISLCSSG